MRSARQGGHYFEIYELTKVEIRSLATGLLEGLVES